MEKAECEFWCAPLGDTLRREEPLEWKASAGPICDLKTYKNKACRIRSARGSRPGVIAKPASNKIEVEVGPITVRY